MYQIAWYRQVPNYFQKSRYYLKTSIWSSRVCLKYSIFLARLPNWLLKIPLLVACNHYWGDRKILLQNKDYSIWLPFSLIIASNLFYRFIHTLSAISYITLLSTRVIPLLSYVKFLGGVSKTSCFTYRHRKKSVDVRSGYLGGQFTGASFSI